VSKGETAAGVTNAERLGIDEHGRASGGITHVSNTKMSFQTGEDILAKDLTHKSHTLVMAHQSAVGNADAGAFLAPVLEGIKTEVGEAGSVFVSINAEDAALFFWSSVRD
jgi:hypothetical protein